MSANRFVFSLGDGIDSITGIHKGRGIITTHQSESDDIYTSKETKDVITVQRQPDNKTSRVMSGDTQYDVTIVKDYTDLYQALDLNACLTTTANTGNLTVESALFKKAKLSNETVSLLIKGKKIGYVHTMPHDAAVPKDFAEELKQRRATFVEAHGDEYISQVMYGKKIYALINFANTNINEALQIKQTLEYSLASKKALISAKTKFEEKESKKHTVTDISIEYSGVEIGLPSIASSIDGLFEFIDQFNKTEIMESPIGFVSEPYVTLIHTREAAELSKQINMVRGLLSEYDTNYNKIRILIPSIEKLVNGVKYFQLEDSNSKNNISRLQGFLDNANQCRKIMEDLILEITLNKTDLTCLPEKLNEKIIIDVPPPLSSQEAMDDDAKSSLIHKRQYAVRNQLNSILKLCSEVISDLENGLATITRHISAEIVRITPKEDHTHLNLPAAGATIRWDIFKNDDKNENGIEYFDVQIKDTSKCFSTYTTVCKRIASGMETKLTVPPNHRLKIAPNSKNDYIIIGSIVGLQALDTSIPRHSTSLNLHKGYTSKKEEPRKRGLIEFNGKTSFSKLSAPWIAQRLSTPKSPSVSRDSSNPTLFASKDNLDTDRLSSEETEGKHQVKQSI